jgi:hypothetical protein
MRRTTYVLRTLLLLMIAAVGVTACASAGTPPEDASTGLFRIQNDTPQESLEIALRNDEGDLIGLGTVSSGETETFLLPMDDELSEYQLVAGAPDMLETSDVIVSRSFRAAEGVTVDWSIQENQLEVG